MSLLPEPPSKLSNQLAVRLVLRLSHLLFQRVRFILSAIYPHRGDSSMRVRVLVSERTHHSFVASSTQNL